MPTTRRYRDNATNKVHDIEWDEDREPSERELRVIIAQQERMKTPVTTEKEKPRAWYNTPMSGGYIGVGARKLSNVIRNPGYDTGETKLGDLITGEEPEKPHIFEPSSWLGKAEGAARGFDRFQRNSLGNVVDYLGDFGDEMTTPADAAATALTFGGSKYLKAGRLGLEAAATGLKSAEDVAKAARLAKRGTTAVKAGNAITGARGAANVYEGLQKDEEGNRDWVKSGLGALEAGLSIHGFKSAGSTQKINEATEAAYGRAVKAEDAASDAVTKAMAADALREEVNAAEKAKLDRRQNIFDTIYKQPVKRAEHAIPRVEYSQPRLGPGTTFHGYGDVIADTRNKPNNVLDDILEEADRRGIQESSPGVTIPRRSAPFSGTGSSLYDAETGEVIKGTVRNRGKGLRESIPRRSLPIRPSAELPDIDVTPLKSEVVAPTQPKPKPSPLGNIEPPVKVDSKKIVDDAYEGLEDKVLKVLAKGGDTHAAEVLASRTTPATTARGSLGDIQEGARGLGARLKTGQKGLLDNTVKSSEPVVEPIVDDGWRTVSSKEPEPNVSMPENTGIPRAKRFDLGEADIPKRQRPGPTVVTPSQANTPVADAVSTPKPVAQVANEVTDTPLPQAKQGNIFSKVKRNLAMINDTDPTIKKLKAPYQNWVNTRAAAKGRSYNLKQDFKDLEEMGMEGVHAYAQGERGGRLADVKKWFDEVNQKVILADLKQTPIGQLWDNSDDEIKSVFGSKKLHIKPGAEFKPIIDTYKEGVEAGLTPKYKSIPQLMGYYSEAADKAIADKAFNQFLKDNNMMGNKKVKSIVRNYLNEDRNPAMKAVLRGIQLTKDVAMASGLPGTAFNAHGFNMLRRSTVVNGIEGFTRSLGYMINPGTEGSSISKAIESVAPWKSAAKTIEENRRLIPEIMQFGGRLGVEGHDFDTKLADAALGTWGNKAANKITELHRELFETHLFDKMIPALKIDYYKSTVDDLIKSGMAGDTARKEAARAMNLAFAGVNYEELATNKGMLDFARMFLLAPDWYASNIGLANNVAKSINPFAKTAHPGAKIYRDIGKGMLGAYGVATAANYMFTGKMMHENASGRLLDIDTGTYTIGPDGEKKKVYISPFGTAFDAFKIPIGVLNELYKDAETGKGSPFNAVVNPVKNRLSLPAHSLGNMIFGYNDLGRSIRGRDAYGNDLSTMTELKGYGKEALNPFTPAYVKGAAGYALGDMSPMEAATQAVEAPFAFSKTPKSKGSGRPNRPRRK